MRLLSVVLFFCYSLPLLSLCFSERELVGKKNFAPIYRKLREANESCGANHYIWYTSRALLAGRLSEALWSAKAGLQQEKLTPQEKQHLEFLLGNVYYELARYEEAIISLRKAAFTQVADSVVAQQAHLLLIKVYFTKAGNILDSNVNYLAILFRRRYPTSPYLTGLLFWLQNPT